MVVRNINMCPGAVFWLQRSQYGAWYNLGSLVVFFFLRCTNPFIVYCDLSVLWPHQAVMYVACIHPWRLFLYDGIKFEEWGPRLYPRIPCVGVGSTTDWLWP